MVKALILICGVFFLTAGVWLSLMLGTGGVQPAEAFGPFFVVAAFGLFCNKKWAAILARMLSALTLGLFFCLIIAVKFFQIDTYDVDILSAAIGLIVFGFPLWLFSQPSVLAELK